MPCWKALARVHEREQLQRSRQSTVSTEWDRLRPQFSTQDLRVRTRHVKGTGGRCAFPNQHAVVRGRYLATKHELYAVRRIGVARKSCTGCGHGRARSAGRSFTGSFGRKERLFAVWKRFCKVFFPRMRVLAYPGRIREFGYLFWVLGFRRLARIIGIIVI